MNGESEKIWKLSDFAITTHHVASRQNEFYDAYSMNLMY